MQTGTAGIGSNAVGEIVAFLTLGSSEAPAYVGSSSGLSLAANLGEMVQATVWNKILPISPDQSKAAGGGCGGNANLGTAAKRGDSSSTAGAIHNRPIKMEDLLANSAEPPNDEMGARILNAYFTRLHPRYPFLDRAEVWRLHEERWRLASTKPEDLSKAERFGIFKLYLVYAIGATMIQLSEKYCYTPPEVSPVMLLSIVPLADSTKRFYMTALQHVSAAREARSIQNIEAMTLLVIYHLRSASSHGMWYMIGLAMRTCIDLGLHRKANSTNLDPFTAQMRRRLFWTVYYLERVIAISLGRPVSISDRHIDLELPYNVDDDVRDPAILTSPQPMTTRTSLTFAICLFQLRRFDSKIQHSIYRADRPLHTLRPKMDKLYRELEEWKASVTSLFSGSELDYPMLHYNRAVRLLIQPFLPLLPITDPYYHICLRAAGDICQTHKRLHQTLEYGHSFLAVQTVFVAGITMLYALWTNTDRVWSVRMSNDIRACSAVLFVMGERAAWVKKYRDAFELLVNATMEKLQGNGAGTTGMAEMMAAHAQHSGVRFDRVTHDMPDTENLAASRTAGTFAETAPEGTGYVDDRDDALRMVMELAPWIDQDEGSPLWMPDFETLEKLSGTSL